MKIAEQTNVYNEKIPFVCANNKNIVYLQNYYGLTNIMILNCYEKDFTIDAGCSGAVFL